MPVWKQSFGLRQVFFVDPLKGCGYTFQTDLEQSWIFIYLDDNNITRTEKIWVWHS